MKRPQTVENARHEVSELLGKKVSVKCNRGRNRISNYSGVLSEVYHNVFVITVERELFDRLSCTYNEVVCGEISLQEKPN